MSASCAVPKRDVSHHWFSLRYFFICVLLSLATALLIYCLGYGEESNELNMVPGQTVQVEFVRMRARFRLSLARLVKDDESACLRHLGRLYGLSAGECSPAGEPYTSGDIAASVREMSGSDEVRTMFAKDPWRQKDIERSIYYLRQAASLKPSVSPDDAEYLTCCRQYLLIQQPQQAANLINEWRHKMPLNAVASDMVNFYDFAAAVYSAAGRPDQADHCAELRDKSRQVPDGFLQPLGGAMPIR